MYVEVFKAILTSVFHFNSLTTFCSGGPQLSITVDDEAVGSLLFRTESSHTFSPSLGLTK